MKLRSALQWLTLDHLLMALFFLCVTATGTTIGFESDSWWHLRSGELIWQSGFVWTTDPLSWTVPGAYWPNHEWLSQILFYGSYRAAGLSGAVALMTVVVLATWVAEAALCGGPEHLRMPAMALGVMAFAVFWSLRPHMFTLLGVPVLLLLLRARRMQPVIPALFLLWANLHGGVVLGGVILVVGAVAAIWYDRSSWRAWLLIVALSALATLCTPLGLGLWIYDISRFIDPQPPYLREWMPPSIMWPLSYPFFLLAALWVGLIAAKWHHLRQRLTTPEGVWPLTLIIVGGLFLLIGFKAIRNTSLFALVALPLIVDLAQVIMPAVPERATSLRRALVHWCGLSLTLALAVGGVVAFWRNDPAHLRPLDPKAIAAVRACPGPLYNTYVLGGPILWFIPERAVFIDSREDPYRPMMLDVVNAETSGDYHAIFTRFNPSCAIVGRRVPLATTLAAAPDWALTYDGDQVLVFAHK